MDCNLPDVILKELISQWREDLVSAEEVLGQIEKMLSRVMKKRT
ncbi:hypothetical protein LCGC14_1419310 [marine sediment metagenome]|uniref:Uncharacterized protein n=1 Tax=marine sediment metagenome TaxID=412755 RepID=A0A0F9M7C7_9ZZZZ